MYLLFNKQQCLHVYAWKTLALSNILDLKEQRSGVAMNAYHPSVWEIGSIHHAGQQPPSWGSETPTAFCVVQSCIGFVWVHTAELQAWVTPGFQMSTSFCLRHSDYIFFKVIFQDSGRQGGQHFRHISLSYLMWPELFCFLPDQRVLWKLKAVWCVHTFKKYLSKTFKA